MKFTKLEHSGCIIEHNGKKLLCDPVEFEVKLPQLANVEVIIITHKHGDHFQPEVLAKVLVDNPNARIFVPQDFELSEISGHSVEKVADNVEWNLSDFNLKFFGKNHASIVPDKISCANLGVIINDKIVNPGDSFDEPNDIENPTLLLVPSAAPWSKISESMNYIQAIQPQIAVPVHNAVLSQLGNSINNNWLQNVCDELGIKFMPLEVGESIEI